MRAKEAELQWLKRLQRTGEVLWALTEGFGCKGLSGGVIEEIRVCLPGARRGDVLLVVKATRGDVKHVAFVGGPDVPTALLTWRQKETRDGLKFREEKPWSGRGGNEGS